MAFHNTHHNTLPFQLQHKSQDYLSLSDETISISGNGKMTTPPLFTKSAVFLWKKSLKCHGRELSSLDFSKFLPPEQS